ncbi:MAG: glycosyltransferase family 39 protein [Acidobacteria bacterium]|nr:glycosyltransferase family 39 protein [Acidobacteriota bacterium]
MWRELSADRRVWAAGVALMLMVQAWRLGGEARQDTQTVDEGIHLTAGYTYLRSGETRIDREHPPLARLLCALPLWWLGVDPKFDSPTWRDKLMVEHSKLVVNGQRGVEPERLVTAARGGTMLLCLLLTLTAAWWTPARLGAAAGWLALLLVGLDPNLNAHGHLVTTDLGAAFTCLLACIGFERMLRVGSWRSVAWAGLALGAALATKYSMVFLVPAFLLLTLAARLPWRRMVPQWAVLLAIALGVVALIYAPETARAMKAQPLQREVDEGGVLNTTLRWMGTRLGVPAHPYLVGLGMLGAHQGAGHPAFLMGEVYAGGKWQYFPVAFLVKTPLGSLLLLALCLPMLRRENWAEWRVFAIPLALFWIMAVTSGINIGLRHLLPVYPLSFVLAAGLLGQRGGAVYGKAFVVAMVLGCGLLGVESARIAGHDLAFFNLAVGGPENGGEYLVDSNLDWGQSLKELREWVGQRRVEDVCLSYFGTAPMMLYGFSECGIVPQEKLDEGERPDRRYMAISVTFLQGVYHKREWYGWLRARKPVAKVGYSIYVYDAEDLLPVYLRR